MRWRLANGSPKPEFETDDARSYFISRLFMHEGFLKEKNGEESELTPLVRQVSNFNQKNERSLSEVVRRYLKMLVETGYIEAQGSTNNSVYKMCVVKLGYSNYITFLCKLVNLIANKIKK